MSPRARRSMAQRTLGVLVAVALAAGACAGGSAGSGEVASSDPSSEEARAYGLGPQPNDEVTFQPDVVIVSGAGGAIRSVEDGGLTWHLDPDASGAADLDVGEVMFVTGRSVGRVLHLVPAEDDLAVTIGPVDLTEVIRDGTFERRGIELGEAVEHSAVPADWVDEADAELAAAPGETAEGADVGDQQDAGAARGRSVAIPAGPQVRAPTAGKAFATCCSNGVGAHFSYDQAGTKLSGNVALTFKKPDASFHLAIRGGSVTRAELKVSGGFGASVDFAGGIDGGNGSITVPFPLHGEFSFPIAQVLGVPLSFTISQSLTIKTAFGTKLGTMTGAGSFQLAGSLGYGYANGRFGDHIERTFATKSSLTNSLSGVPVGVMGLLIRHRVRLNVGFSAYVLRAGVYLDVDTTFGVTRGSALGAVGSLGSHFVECQGVALGVWARFGIGFSILEPVVNAINRFLSLFDVRPIPREVGIHAPPIKVHTAEEVIPDVELCGRPTGAASATSGSSA